MRLLFFYLCSFLSYGTSISVQGVSHEDPGSPVFLTPFIEAGEILKGQEAAYIDSAVWNIEGIPSYAGYLTVNKTYNSNLYFWYFPAEISPEKSPVVLWLQGGPGGPSLFGLFEEHGAFYFDLDGNIKTRQYRWSKTMNVIYIDNPVGTGFSFTDTDEGYAKGQEQIGKELLSAITQFFQLFPELKNNDFYITGESYAGKYVPTLGYSIHKSNKKNSTNINLKGIAIGNGLIDPETMTNYADHFYQLGLIDKNMQLVFHQKQAEIVNYIKLREFRKATEGFQNLILGNSEKKTKSLFYNTTGFSYFYNLLHFKNYSLYGDMDTLIQKAPMRKAIHVGNLTYHADPKKVEESLFEDITKSVKPWFQVLLENYKILIYSGQLDLIVPYSLTLDFLHSLQWSGRLQYKTAERKLWRVGEELAGYSKTAKGLTEVLVRNAGHMVPTDQPQWAFDLISRFVYNKPF